MRAIRFSPIWSDAAPPSTRPWTRGDRCPRRMPPLRALNSTAGKQPSPPPPSRAAHPSCHGPAVAPEDETRFLTAARIPRAAGGVVIVSSLGALAGWQLAVAGGGRDRCSRSVLAQEVRTDGGPEDRCARAMATPHL